MPDRNLGLVPSEAYIAGIKPDLVGDRDTSASSLDRLLHTVDQHIAQEGAALEQYEHLARASGDGVIALVMQLILEDEERHHGLLKRLATTLRDGLDWTHSPAALPQTPGDTDPTIAADLAVIARALIDEERTGAQTLRHLAAGEGGLASGLDGLLLEMMAMDSEKHAHLLKFVEKRLESRAHG